MVLEAGKYKSISILCFNRMIGEGSTGDRKLVLIPFIRNSCDIMKPFLRACPACCDPLLKSCLLMLRDS
jgi:hypothetical protein